MSQKTLLNRLEIKAPGWNRSTGIRTLQSEIQNGLDELFDTEGPRTIFIDPSTGFPPYITTVDSTFEYELTATNLSVSAIQISIDGVNHDVNIRHCLKVFMDVSQFTDYSRRWLGKPFQYYGTNPYTYQLDKLAFAEVPVDSYERMSTDTPAKIMFKENPGDTTDRYYAAMAWEPPRLTSENIPLPIPIRFEEALYDYVLGKVQGADYDVNKRLLHFYDYWKPEFEDAMHRGAQSYSRETPRRDC